MHLYWFSIVDAYRAITNISCSLSVVTNISCSLSFVILCGDQMIKSSLVCCTVCFSRGSIVRTSPLPLMNAPQRIKWPSAGCALTGALQNPSSSTLTTRASPLSRSLRLLSTKQAHEHAPCMGLAPLSEVVSDAGCSQPCHTLLPQCMLLAGCMDDQCTVIGG